MPQVVEAGVEEDCKKFARYSYPLMTKQQGNFHLTVRKLCKLALPYSTA